MSTQIFATEAAKSAANRNQFLAFVNDAENEEVVRQYLSGALIPFSTVRRGNVANAVQYLANERSPNVLLVDISGSDLPISEINRLAEVCEPGVTVIALGDRNDVGLYRDLLKVGVNDYLVKPLTRELLQKSLSGEAAVEASRISQKLGKVVSFVGARGGVGTSTLATNLAWFLANKRGRRVALLDLDLQNGDCGLLLNLKPTPGLREALEKPQRVDNLFVDRAMTRSGERLFVLSAEEPMDSELSFDPAAVENLISVLQSQFHYVIVDLPRTCTRMQARVLEMASVRVIVADLTMGAVRDTIRLHQRLGESGPARQTMLVINRKGAYGRGELPVEEFTKVTEMQPHLVIPFQSKSVVASVNQGTPIAEKRNRFALAVASLATEVSGQKQQGRRGGLLSRIFR